MRVQSIPGHLFPKKSGLESRLAGGRLSSLCHYWFHLMNLIILQMNLIITLILYHIIILHMRSRNNELEIQ